MRTRRANWIKRITAVIVTAGMILTMPGFVQAANVTENTATVSTEEQSEDMSGEEATEDRAESTERELVELETAEEETETVEEGPVEDEQGLPATTALSDADTPTPNLTLETAETLSTKLTKKGDTIEVQDGEGLILLSNVNPEEYQNKTISLYTTSGWDLTQSLDKNGTSYSFLGLGSTGCPFKGTFELDKSLAATNYSITTTKALFNGLSSQATLGMLPFSIPTEDNSMTDPLLTKTLAAVTDGGTTSQMQWNLILRNPTADSKDEFTIGGLIGTMEENASVDIVFENNFQGSLKVSGIDHIGLFCNTMKTGSSLTAEYKKSSNAGSVSVATTVKDKDAGGFVGHMETDTGLTIAGASVNEVRSEAGNAGGIVGSVIDGSLTVKQADGDTSTPGFTFADPLTLRAGEENAAGGLIGTYSITKDGAISCDLSNYKFGQMVISGGQNAGGLFGALKNTGKVSSLVTILGGTDNILTAKTDISVTNFGGLIGAYQSDRKENILAIRGDKDSLIQVVSTGGQNVDGSYGGVIGSISGNSYVEIENVLISTGDMKGGNLNASFGGLVGRLNNGMLNVGSVTLKTSGNNDISGDYVGGRGGLVGYLVKGVLRLHDTTDLSEQKVTTAYSYTGQIVGKNVNGLIYALGDGSSLGASGEGWSLIRYNGKDRGGSDIGNWGAVVRLGEYLRENSEGIDELFIYDEASHTVTVNNGTGSIIGDTKDFAAYALAFDLSKAYTESDMLYFKNKVDSSTNQSVTLTGDIDLTGTGILGIGRDNVEKGATTQKFSGILNGGGHKLTLDIGTVYGTGVSVSDNAAGQLYAKRSDQRDAHYSLALIPFSGEVTIQDVIIAGSVNCKLPGTVKQEENAADTRYPAFISAVVGLAAGQTTYENVKVDAAVSITEETNAKKLHVWQSGFLARCEGSKLQFRNCTWGNGASLSDERNTDNHRIGGMAAEIMGGCSVSVNNCILSGNITSAAEANACVGGLIAVSRGEIQNGTNNSFSSKTSTINISGLQVDNETITSSANKTSGGLLGYRWQNTDVVFASTDNMEESEIKVGGVIISGSELNAEKAQFGGLVYQASGYWNATAKDSIVFTTDSNGKGNSFTGRTEKAAPSGLIVGTGLIRAGSTQEEVTSALYLEAGTWGSASGAAYRIDKGAVTLKINGSDYFDELVGITRADDAGNNNAVVSLAVCDGSGKNESINKSTQNTYTGQIGNYKNIYTRYYYNLDSYRKSNPELKLDTVTSPENLVLWSVSQYAAENIRKYFRAGSRTDVIIAGEINLTGYSYYPVTPLGAVNLGNGSAVTSLTFDYENMNAKEENKKQFSDPEYQHYRMQYGLLYNTSHNVAVRKTVFSGTVGREITANDNTYNSGALILGSVAGNSTGNIVELSLKEVTLAGIRVADIQNGDIYSPLLINQITQKAKLTIDTLSTGEGYTSGSGTEKMTAYAATSLVGKAGSANASKLTLSFANIALDGRVAADSTNSTSVYNNGKVTVEYHTTHTIFTRATLLESFMYSSDGSGTYNFNSTDNMVTYGVELTNSENTGRNPDKQYQYYDGEIYVTDQKDKTADDAYVKDRYKGSNFIRYVYLQQDIASNQYELDINQKATGLLKGCGTYGDPYIIEDAHQLISLADYIKGGSSKFQVVFNSRVLKDQMQTAVGYHTRNGANSDESGTDNIYTWENNVWKSAEQTLADKESATRYLINAYYKIDKDITLSAENYSGIGTLTKPFSGVIVSSTSATISIKGKNSNKVSFGGLIAYSRGSVVKDLTVDYTQAEITIQAEKLPGVDQNPFFGGVVGYCMGGDTIIDQVSVTYGSNSVILNGTYQELIAAGGYIGLVGGTTHVTESTDYEKTGGGVVFRNMSGTTNTFAAACPDAKESNKTVNMTDKDSAHMAGQSTGDGGDYFYRNPYVGRVLDGYACAENCTVDNTDKNYTIQALTKGTNDLKVTDNGGNFDVTVASAQGLWLLSAIVNSGAGAMDSQGSYTDVDGKVVDAYQYGKPRTVAYDGIGTLAGDTAASRLSDEKYWGGVESSGKGIDAKFRVSYLVKNYTAGTAAAHLSGKNDSGATNNPVNLTFATANIDMSIYGNGFRGIGSSYGENKKVWTSDCRISKVYRRNLLINSINKDAEQVTNIVLNMNQNDYSSERMNGSWNDQGAGLFVGFHFTDGCTVNRLQISGNVKLGLYESKSNLTKVEEKEGYDVGVGGFAARTVNSSGMVTFSDFCLDKLNVYGGTMTGGAIGFTDGWGTQSDRKSHIKFSDWSIDTVTVLKWVNNNGSTGGLVGWNVCYDILEITGDDEAPSSVSNLKVTTLAESFSVAAAGGLAGACDYGSVTIKNVNVHGLIVSGKNLREIGGLIAGGRQNTGNIEVSNCTLNEIEVTLKTNNKYKEASTGGVIGYHDKILTISSVKMQDSISINGQQYTGGFIGRSSNDVTISNCEENNVNIMNDMNWSGGFIGHVQKNKTAVIENCKENNVNILGRYVGGLAGTVDGNMKVTNMEFIKVMAVINKKSPQFSGILIGNIENEANANSNITGYNILADSCKTGYCNTTKIEALPTLNIQSIGDCGFWIGKTGAKDTVNLTAVSIKGNAFPQIDIGTKNGTSVIVYADAAADQTYKPVRSEDKPYPSVTPWLDVNPKSEVKFSDDTVMTGNAVGTKSAQEILTGLRSAPSDMAFYWNLKDSKDVYLKFLDSSNDAYVTTYRSEESATTAVDSDVDFPVFVVNNTGEVDTVLWNYIAAMTNVSSGTEAKTQVKAVKAVTYKWDKGIRKFEAQDNSSIKVNATSKKLSITPNAYDNQNSQFTLLDVTYENPTDKSKVFHLYIPVLVKKVLYIDFDAKFLAGTDYCADDYPAKGQEGHYATAGFDEPLTAYMEYNYDKDTDWQSMLDNGENLLWYYDKQLNLAEGSSADAGTLLPAGTKLTLVDRQTTQYYTYTAGAGEDVHSFDLSRLTAPDGTAFSPVYICDLLGLKAETADTGDSGSAYYVVESDKTKATIRIGDIYYRKAEDKDTGEKYKITADSDLTKKGCSESYYLTIRIPETENVSVINNRLNYAAVTRKEGALPARIYSKPEKSGSNYVVYNGVEQTLTVQTNRVHNGSDMGDTAMENGDGIKIKLQSRLKLTEAGKGRFDKLGPAEFYHQFDISLKEYLQNEGGSDTMIGTENITYRYTAVAGGKTIYTANGTIQNAAGQENLLIQYEGADGGTGLKKALETATDDTSAVTITAEVLLTYATADKFPVRNTSDNDDGSGISTVLTSRIANSTTQLPIATGNNKKTTEDTNRYYTADQTKAMLTYTTVDGDGVGDATQQLGINPSDEANPADLIYTRADYDYTNVDAEALAKADKISYKLELFCKQADGSYNENMPLPIGDYLQNSIVKDDGEALSAGNTSCQWKEAFVPVDTKHQFIRLRFSPLTGEEFEKRRYTYSNYRVRLTVVLLDKDGTEIPGTQSSDYIIYTNARIYQELLD